MAYFPSFGPFYDPDSEQEVHGEQESGLIVRKRPPTPTKVGSSRRFDVGRSENCDPDPFQRKKYVIFVDCS